MSPRPIEVSAPDTLRELVAQLSALVEGQPTTEELELVLASTVPAVQRLLREWISSRNLNKAHAERSAEFRERRAKVAEFVDRISPRPSLGLHPVFADLASPFVQRRRS